MTIFLKKLMSFIIVTVMVCLVAAPIGASATVYPQGVTSAQAENAIDNTDQLINGLLKNFADTSLKELVMPEICSDATLSLLLTEVYKALEKNADSISALGLDVSVSNVAYYLSNYKQVSAKLKTYSSWEQVNLDGVSWGVKDKQSFAVAASAMFGPLNSLLHTLLCGGTYPIVGALVSVRGEKGYENSILPLYRTLGLDSYTSPASFYALASADRYTIIFCIVLDLLNYVERVLATPAQLLSDRLPAIAHFITNGSLEATISKLLEPLRISVMGVPILKVDSFVDLSSLEGGMDINLDIGSSALDGFKTAPLDLEVFASCGTVSGDTVIANKGDVYIELLRWIIETVKLNQNAVTALLNSSEIDTQQLNIDINSLVSNLLSKPTDEIISILVNLLAGDGAVINNYQWSFRHKRDNTAVYTENLSREDFERALSEVDDLVNQLVAEGGEFTTLRELLTPKLYSNSLLTQLACKLYTYLQNEELEKFISMLNIDLSPVAVSASLTEEQFSTVASQLSNLSSWEYLNKDTVDWGFKDGDKEGFINAISAILRPADALFRTLFAGGKITLLESLDFYGSDGYNTAVIPLLEALGVYYEDIPTYKEYLEAIKNGDTIKPIITSLFTLVERVLDKPIYTVTEILPNLMYFLNNGGLSICASNLIYPITNALDKLGLSGLVDFSQLTSIDVNALLGSLLSGFNISFSLPELNLSQFEGMGELAAVNSKRTQNGSAIQIYAVKADQPAVLVTILRYAMETIKLPGNDSFILDLISSSEELGSNSLVTGFAQGITENISKMTVDETVEWFFNIFFSERVTVDNLEGDNYTPEVNYESAKKFPTDIVTTIILVILMITAVMVLTNRDKIKFFLQDRKK